MTSNTAWAETLRCARIEADLSQRQLAAKLGWSQTRVATLELGKRAPKMSEISEPGTLRGTARGREPGAGR
jgi:predicted transcriptional regulator